MLQLSNLSRVMEPETISKNGASPKSHMSKGNTKVWLTYLLISLAVFFVGSSCSHDGLSGYYFSQITKGPGYRQDVSIEFLNSSEFKLTTDFLTQSGVYKRISDTPPVKYELKIKGLGFYPINTTFIVQVEEENCLMVWEKRQMGEQEVEEELGRFRHQ